MQEEPMMFRKLLIATVATAAIAPFAIAENQVWTSLELKKKSEINSKFEYALNSEVRFDPDGDTETIVLRPGVGYKVNDTLKLSGGYRFSSTRRSGDDTIEHRIWQQAGYDLFEVGSLEVAGRTRLEQRWRETNNDLGWRIRQQISLEHPIEGTKLKIGLSDEAIFGLNDTAWGNFEGLQENRAKAVVKGKVGRVGWEAGYLNQYKNGINGRDDETNHHIVIGLSAGF
jgi:hypothetical protein